MRVVPTWLHGVGDMLYVVTALALPNLLGWSRRTRRVMGLAAGFTLLYSALTRYEFGLIKLLPMKVHLLLDGLVTGSLLLGQFQLTEEESEPRAVITGLELVGAVLAALTRTR